ncbi:hypothetical protein BV898_05528 [Hypsibius exemplaris]|uniref:PH domain-containing protein n=1 Tax=Hypsibius exemplaris TaxID=2072580 RepID=A0A1W0WZ56_HYPEX|nr:hypothetical protein BV898_05528 [Hypsibius exemplaris]
MSAPIMEGFLMKNRYLEKKSGWRGRWFTLRTATGSPDRYVLEYAEDKKKKPSCQIDLTHCTYVVALKPMVIKDNYKHVFTVKTTKQQYYLENDDDDDEENDGELNLIRFDVPESRSYGTHSPTSNTSTLQHDSNAQFRPSPLVLHPSNFAPNDPRPQRKGDSPYIFLAQCVSKAVGSRPSSQTSLDNGRASTGLSDREPDIPLEPAPPPPDDLYKIPPYCIVSETESTTYDTPPVRGDFPRHLNEDNSLNGGGPIEPVPTTPNSETYDRLPPLFRNVGQRSTLTSTSTSTVPRMHARKQSLPNDVEIHFPDSGGGVYDQVPKPRTANSSPAVTRAQIPEPESGLYDRPAPRSQLEGRDSLTSPRMETIGGKLSSPRPSSSSLSPRLGNAPPPPSIDRNAKPNHGPNHGPSHGPNHGHSEDSISADRSPRSRGVVSPPTSTGSAATPGSASMVIPPGSSAFAYPRQHSLTTTTPMQKVRRSTSQEDLAAPLGKSDFRLRDAAGTRTLPRQPKYGKSADVQYTDVQICCPGGGGTTNSSNSKTLPSQKAPPMSQRNSVEPLTARSSLKSQFSQRGQSISGSSTGSCTSDYKFIDETRTRGLQKTKEAEEKRLAAEKRIELENNKDKRKN